MVPRRMVGKGVHSPGNIEAPTSAFAHPTTNYNATISVETPMTKITTATTLFALACALLAATSLAPAADVTFERLFNPEPQNWLMNHRTYDAQRHSPLDQINKSNIKDLKLKFA